MKKNGPAKGQTILCFNSGSSSLKFSLYKVIGDEAGLLARGAMERIGLQGGHLWIDGPGNNTLLDAHKEFDEHEAAVQAVFTALEELSLPQPAAAGHRLVHGGPNHAAPERVDRRLCDTLRELIPFAPLHLPGEIMVIEAVAARFPGLSQVACFDTAFHRRMPKLAQLFPLPRDLWNQGIRRYGFHGLSYEYVVETLRPAAKDRTIVAHLGNGASMAAVRGEEPLDTTMGFTPTGGFMMGTRSGDLDPGILLYLMNEKGYDSRRIERLVNQEAGLLGVSGLSPDMETLLERRGDEPDAALAVDLFCYQVRKHIGALTAVLGGMDTLVFTGGIGERAAAVRWEACRGLEYLGLHIDRQRNRSHANTISTAGSPCTVRVIPTNEDRMIIRHTQRLLFQDLKK